MIGVGVAIGVAIGAGMVATQKRKKEKVDSLSEKISIASSPTLVGFFVCGMIGRFGYGPTINGKSNA